MHINFTPNIKLLPCVEIFYRKNIDTDRQIDKASGIIQILELIALGSTYFGHFNCPEQYRFWNLLPRPNYFVLKL